MGNSGSAKLDTSSVQSIQLLTFTVKMKAVVLCEILFLNTIVNAGMKDIMNPRKLTRMEALSDDELNLKSILSQEDEDEEDDTSLIGEKDVTFLARGTNIEASHKDFVRMPGTLWC